MKHAETIYQHLEKKIISGELQPGQRLDETELCLTFGVSRTPVRDAFLQLAAVGLVELRQRQGVLVTAISLVQMAQMFEVMAEIEAHCASLAAQRMTLTEQNLLVAAQADCLKFANDGSEEGLNLYFNANYAFHQIMYAGAHNDFLYQQTLNLRNRLTPYRRFRLQNPARLKASSEEHQEILEGILEGNKERAAAAVRQHLTIQWSLLADLSAAFEHAQPKKLA